MHTLAYIEWILRPIWSRKTETAARLRSRIEAVIDYGYIAEGIDRRNPAAFKGNLEHRGFGKRRKITPVVNHPAAPYASIPAIMDELRALNSTTALCLRFIIPRNIRQRCTFETAVGAYRDVARGNRGQRA